MPDLSNVPKHTDRHIKKWPTIKILSTSKLHWCGLAAYSYILAATTNYVLNYM